MGRRFAVAAVAGRGIFACKTALPSKKIQQK
jgi:hypothetical protein